MAIHVTLSEKWLKAAAVGSLWASIEIVLGSFLHNIRFPMAGTLLSFLSVGLMVSFLRMWPVKGLIWRAGLICALMKSISPSAIILGPMTGILMEALLMEFFIRIFGINVLGMVFGGMAGVLSALFHKVVNLLILYGSDLAALFDNLVRFASKQIGLKGVGSWELIMILAGFYIVMGAIAAWSGWKIAARIHQAEPAPPEPIAGSQRSRLFQYSDPQGYSLVFLIIHLTGLAGILLAMNRFKVWIWLPLTLLYLTVTLIRYRRGMRQLLRPRLWIQLLIITILATMFLQGIETGKVFTVDGMVAGLMMNLRAVLLLTGFSAIGTELKNPIIKSILYKRGFASLYHSLSLSFTILPDLLSQWNLHRKDYLRIRHFIENLLMRADDIYRRIEEINRNLPPVFIITGNREEGKTRFVSALVDECRSACHEAGKQDKRIIIGGFCAEGVHDKNGIRKGYMIQHCVDGESVMFCELGEEIGSERIGKFNIFEKGLKTGISWLDPERIKDADLVIIDEMGPLELSGRGWAPAIDKILSDCPKPMIWTVRRSLVEKLARKWTLGQVSIWDVSKIGVSEAMADLKRHLIH